MSNQALADLTVGQVIKSLPGSIGILNKHLIDTCCGEHRSLRLAAEDANATLDVLLGELSVLEGAQA